MDDRQKDFPFSRISEEEKARRKAEVDFARRSVRYEGHILSDEIEALNEKYINGELTLKEHGEAVRESVWSMLNA